MTEIQKQALVEAMKAIGDVIREIGGVPSGHLYARLMEHMSLDTYNAIIGALKQCGKVRESNHFLTWVD